MRSGIATRGLRTRDGCAGGGGYRRSAEPRRLVGTPTSPRRARAAPGHRSRPSEPSRDAGDQGPDHRRRVRCVDPKAQCERRCANSCGACVQRDRGCGSIQPSRCAAVFVTAWIDPPLHEIGRRPQSDAFDAPGRRGARGPAPPDCQRQGRHRAQSPGHAWCQPSAPGSSAGLEQADHRGPAVDRARPRPPLPGDGPPCTSPRGPARRSRAGR